MKRAIATTLVATALGCQVAPTGAGPSTAPRAATPKASSSPAARPSAAASPFAPAARASAAADAGAAKLPTRIVPPLPPSLRAAAGLVGADGGTLIGADGGSMVAAGAGNYALRQAPGAELSEMIRGQLQIYLVTTMVTEGILLAAAAASLQPGATLTFPDDGNDELTAAEKADPANHLTVRLVPAGDHARVEVYRGPTAVPEKQVAGISFTSVTQGRALLRDPQPKKDGTQNWVATTFDLDAGTSTADVYAEGPGPARARLRVAFAAHPGAGAAEPTFTVRTTAYGKDPAKGDDGVIAISANFRDEGAAAIVGARPAAFAALLGEAFVFIPSDGSTPDPRNAAPHAFFLDAMGKDVPAAAAAAALKGMVPADDDLARPVMTDPTVPKDRAPLDEAVFRFPD